MDIDTTEIESLLSSFGSSLIQKARANLNKKGKRAKGTLFNEMSYDIEKSSNGIKFKMDFGNADDYWEFIDQGVQGSGGFKGSGRKRGEGSPFKFSRRQPPLRAILPWISIKGLKGRDKKGRFITKNSLGFLIARSIKQRGLERTLFISKPYEEMIGNLKSNIASAFTKDIDNSIELEQPHKIEINLSKK
jgi:hypothetical protein